MSIYFTLDTAKNVAEDDHFGKNDLYAVITYGGQKTTSEVAKDGTLGLGHRYSWGQTFSFDLKDNDNDIEVKLYDKDFGFDDFIGEAKFKLTQAKTQGTAVETVDVITKKREVKGQITAKIAIKH